MQIMKSDKPALLGGTPIFDETIPITKPTIPPLSPLVKSYKKVLQTGLLTNGSHVRSFELAAQQYLGVKHVIALNSCTTGLMLLIKTLGLRGKVIVPSFSFRATGHAVVWSGCEPVFVDCDKATFNIDPDAVERAVSSETSCIIGVHVFGNPANVKRLEQITKKKKIRLFFDAAHGFGSIAQGHKIGKFGDAEVFSLSPTKLLTAGEGGLVATNDAELAEQIRTGRNYGNSGNYEHDFVGLSARMSEFNALLGVESLKILEFNIENRNRLATLYRKRLSSLPGITFQSIASGDRSTYKDLSIVIDPEQFGLSRNLLNRALTAERIETRNYFDPPIHRQKVYKDLRECREPLLPNTTWLSTRIVSLPLYSHLMADVVEKICEAVNRIHRFHREISVIGKPDEGLSV